MPSSINEEVPTTNGNIRYGRLTDKEANALGKSTEKKKPPRIYKYNKTGSKI
jgi:hypothetical protein